MRNYRPKLGLSTKLLSLATIGLVQKVERLENVQKLRTEMFPNLVKFDVA